MIALTLKGTETVSLKALLKTQDTQNITLSVTIAPNSVVHVHDDLVEAEFLSTTTNSIIKQKLEFFVQENSTVHYHLALVPHDLEHKNISQITCAKELIFRLIGPGANAQAHGSCFANGSQMFTFKTLQDHQVYDTTSNLLIKGVLDGSARVTCSSMIQISKGAQRSNALQANKNIVLSKAARAISIPQLEIEANDVTCKHGAAISNINNEHLFYLQSRGLGLVETRKMLIDGFLAL